MFDINCIRWLLQEETPPIDPIPDDPLFCLLRIPEKYLDEKQKAQQYKNFENLPKLRKSFPGNEPTSSESNLVLEYLMFMSLFKLMERASPYKILEEAMKIGDKEKVFEIMKYNARMIEVFKKNLITPDTKIHIYPKKDGYDIVDLKPFDVIKEITKERITKVKVPLGKDVSETTISETNGTVEHGDSNGIQQGRSEFYDISESGTSVQSFSSDLEKIMSLAKTEKNDQSDKSKKEHAELRRADQEQFAKELHSKILEEKEENEKIHETLVKDMEAELEKFRKLNKEQEQCQREQEKLAMKIEEASRNRLDEEFKRKLEEQIRNHKEILKELREKREAIEREAEEARLKSCEEFAARTKVFWHCVLLKIRWEDQEQEWADWLRELKIPVGRAKIQFMKFQEAVGYSEDIDEEAIKTELKFLRLKTLSAHDILYRAFFYLKGLSDKVPDKIFLRIMMKNVREVAMKVLVVLENIDKIQINESMTKSLKVDFDTFDSSDILSTWKLREIASSCDPAEYDNIEDPLKYEEASEPNCLIEEVLEGSEGHVESEDDK